MIKLSAVIITHNEEKNIGRCLDSIKDIADDIVIVDSHSVDRTKEIAGKYSAQFIQADWQGYSTTKNHANSFAKYDWILSLDADEALSEQLKKSIAELKKNTDRPVIAKFNRYTNYCGKWIRHCGWYPDTKIRLFDRRTCRWAGEIHENLILPMNTAILHLKGDCLHYSYYSKENHLTKIKNYTNIAAKELFSKGKKNDIVSLYLSPVTRFIRDYFLKLGILDGQAGLTICRLNAYSTFLKYKKLRALHKSK